MLSVSVLLVVAAFVCTIAEALGKCPGWVVDILVVLILALMVLPK
jgi:hypothetical protein